MLNPSPPTLTVPTSASPALARTSHMRTVPSEPTLLSSASCTGFHATRSVPTTPLGPLAAAPALGREGAAAAAVAAAVVAEAGAATADASSFSSVLYLAPGRSGFHTRMARASAAARSVPSGEKARDRVVAAPDEAEDVGMLLYALE